ncbi:MAG: hypothetical protein JST54_15250 [Deltaproteobacteria bacterium]|nr:hypothetical protein [Deltaproteobacteria bacterium]
MAHPAEPTKVELVQDQPAAIGKGLKLTLKNVLYTHATNAKGESVNDALMMLEATRDGKKVEVQLERLFPGPPTYQDVLGLQLAIDYVDAYHQPSTGAVLVMSSEASTR